MILTGAEIKEQVANGRILLDPFDSAAIGPNSVDLHLDSTMLVYKRWCSGRGDYLDMAIDNPTDSINIPRQGRILYPGYLYLASTIEKCGSDHFVTCIEGRSSVGRLGISIHKTAGVGDIGFKSHWVLEIDVIIPVKIYPGIRICQALFFTPYGNRETSYSGKYVTQSGPVASRIHLDKEIIELGKEKIDD